MFNLRKLNKRIGIFISEKAHFFSKKIYFLVKADNLSIKKGFTLIEMIVVIAMIGILSMASLKLVRFSDIYKSLNLTTAEVKGMLRTAQTLSLAPPVLTKNNGEEYIVCGFGVRTPSDNKDKLEIFYSYSMNDDPVDCREIAIIDNVCNETTNNCAIYEKAKEIKGFTFSDDSSNPVKIFFRSPYGKTIGADGGYTIKITQDDNGYSKEIEINQYGKINEN